MTFLLLITGTLGITACAAMAVRALRRDHPALSPAQNTPPNPAVRQTLRRERVPTSEPDELPLDRFPPLADHAPPAEPGRDT